MHSSDPDPTNQVREVADGEEANDIPVENVELGDVEYDDHHNVQSTSSVLESLSAKLLMGLKEERKLTQTALQGI